MDGLSPFMAGLYVALAFVACWVVLLAHELGHAAVGLTSIEGLVRVRVGRSPGIWRARLGRLQLELHPLPARNEPDGLATTYAPLDQTSAVLHALAGPGAGCLAAVILLLFGLHSGYEPLAVVGSLIAFSQLLNLLPSTIHGQRSDGAVVRELFRTRRPPRPSDPAAGVFARWLVLFTDARGATADARGVAGLFVGVLGALDRAREDRSAEARALVQLVFAGWCWREVERGDTAPIRNCVLDTRMRATVEGRTRADIATSAAAELVHDRADLAAASPTSDSLEKGFGCASARVRTGSLPAEHAEFAFRYGVALHDVVTLAF
jgi:hypothetical protein